MKILTQVIVNKAKDRMLCLDCVDGAGLYPDFLRNRPTTENYRNWFNNRVSEAVQGLRQQAAYDRSGNIKTADGLTLDLIFGFKALKSISGLIELGFKEKLPMQMHHFATNKSTTYTPQMEAIAEKFGLKLDDI